MRCARANPMRNDDQWLILLCMGRAGLSVIFTAYSAVLPFVTVEWNMTSAQAGSVQSAWHVGYLFSLFAAGFLADRFGAKKTLLRMTIASTIASGMFAIFSHSYLSALVLYGLAGLCSGGSYTPGLKLIFERTHHESRGLAMGVFLAAGSIGFGLALVLAAFIIPFAGWRSALILCAFVTAAGSFIMLYSLRTVEETAICAAPSRGPKGAPDGWSDLFKNRAASACVLAYTFHCWELLGMWAWLPSFLIKTQVQATGMLVTYGLLAVALSHFVSSVGSVLGGRLSDRHGRPFVMLFMSIASLLCSFTIGWLFGGSVALVFILAIAYNLFAIGDSAVYSTAVAEVVPANRLGAVYSIRSVLGFGVGAISPWVFGMVLDLGQQGTVTQQTAWGLAWTSLAIGALPGIPMILWFRKLILKKRNA
jgi:MFS family permease